MYILQAILLSSEWSNPQEAAIAISTFYRSLGSNTAFLTAPTLLTLLDKLQFFESHSQLLEQTITFHNNFVKIYA